MPGLALSDEGAVSLSDKAQIEKFLSEAVEAYRSQGLVSTKPELEGLEPPGRRLSRLARFKGLTPPSSLSVIQRSCGPL